VASTSHRLAWARRAFTQTTVITSLVTILIGIGLLYWGGRDDLWTEHHGLQALVNGVAGLLIVSMGLGLLWQLGGKRAFAREILESATAGTDADAAGLTRIGMNYAVVPDWEALFRDVRKLDIFFAYGRTWRNLNIQRLQSVAMRADTRIRVFLPDPEHEETIARLAERFEMESVGLVSAINEAQGVYSHLACAAGSTVEVYHRQGDSLFSCYRFDNTAVMTLYSHQRVRTEVPTFVCRAGGFLYDFLREEFRAIQAQSVRSHPPGQ
jgi:hypothetical protein